MLVSEDGRAILSEFGTPMAVTKLESIAETQIAEEYARWTAPELLKASEQSSVYPFCTKASDVWAFGMVVYVCRILMPLGFN